MKNRVISFEQAKARYPHRFTMEHLPQWAKKPHINNGEFVGFYKPHYRTDAEWYANTIFPGEMDIPKKEKHCYSRNQTWPLGEGFSPTPCVIGQSK